MANGSAKRRPTIGMITAGPLIELAGEQWRGVSDGALHLGCDLLCFVGSELDHPDAHKRRANTVGRARWILTDLNDPWAVSSATDTAPEQEKEVNGPFHTLDISGQPLICIGRRAGGAVMLCGCAAPA